MERIDQSKRALQWVLRGLGSASAMGFCAVLGALLALLTRDVYVPIVVPIVLGAGVGAVMGVSVFVLEMQHRSAVYSSAIAAWLIATVAFHHVEYRVTFVQAVERELALDMATFSPTPSDLHAAAERALVEAVGRDGFLGFMQLRARGGVRSRLTGRTFTGYVPGVTVWALDLILGFSLVLKIVRGVHRRRILEGSTH